MSDKYILVFAHQIAMCAKITDTNPKVIKQVALFRLNQWFSEVGVVEVETTFQI